MSEHNRAHSCCVRTPSDRGYYPPATAFACCDRALAKLGGRSRSFRFVDPATRVYDVTYNGLVVRSETRKFENASDAVEYACDRVPVGEAFVVVRPLRGFVAGSRHATVVATFGSKPALRNGGWI